MPIKVLMPALSPTMTEGKLAKWHVSTGDTVNSGDIIAEIETDKATMEVEAVEEGTVGRLLIDEGAEGVAVNSIIALLLEEGEGDGALDDVDMSASVSAPAAPAPPPAAAPPPVSAAPIETPKPPTAAAASGVERIFASPLARRMAEQAGLALDGVAGSGPNGRIVKRDIETAIAGGGVAAAPAAAEAAPQPAPAAAVAASRFEPEFELVPATSMRKTIARRLSESKQTVPHFYLSVECEIDELLALRKSLNEKADGAFKISVNDLVVRAAALALRHVPAANASWAGDGIRYYKSADISVAVATEGGLITPVVRQADNKGLEAISNETKVLAAKARDGKLMPEEYEGGTFSISNLGMYGIREFSAVINPPQACILAVGAGEARPVVKDGAVAVATVMNCTLSVDHRAVDGAVGAEFLQVLKGLLEDPLRMLL